MTARSLVSVTNGDSFQFRLKTEIHFGRSATAKVPDLLRKFGFRHVGVTIDGAVQSQDPVVALLESVGRDFELTGVVVNDIAEPDYEHLDRCREVFVGKPLDVMIAIGGGSSLDLGKGISALHRSSFPAIQYRGSDLVKEPGAKIIAIPTTAGSGSEVTPNAVFTDSRERRKLGINGEFDRPIAAVLDPVLTASCPRSVTASSGMDALVHAVESFVARGHSTMSRLFSREAFRLVFNQLPRVFERPDVLAAREGLQLGALYAGIALMNAGAGPAGALSYPLGVHHKVPHGIAGGVFLARVAQANVAHGFSGYGELYDVMEGADHSLDAVAKSRRFVDAVLSWTQQIGVPTTLRGVGLGASDVPVLAAHARGLRAAFEMNPVSLSDRDVEVMLEAMIS